MEPIIFDESESDHLAALVEQRINGENDPESVYYVRRLVRPKIHWGKIAIAALIPLVCLSAVFVLWKQGLLDLLFGVALIAAFLVFYFVAIGKKSIVCIVRIYQRYAPDSIRNKCRFEPSCSEYMVLAIEKYGLFRGVKKGISRLFRCNGNHGGYDYP